MKRHLSRLLLPTPPTQRRALPKVIMLITQLVMMIARMLLMLISTISMAIIITEIGSFLLPRPLTSGGKQPTTKATEHCIVSLHFQFPLSCNMISLFLQHLVLPLYAHWTLASFLVCWLSAVSSFPWRFIYPSSSISLYISMTDSWCNSNIFSENLKISQRNSLRLAFPYETSHVWRQERQ